MNDNRYILSNKLHIAIRGTDLQRTVFLSCFLVMFINNKVLILLLISFVS